MMNRTTKLLILAGVLLLVAVAAYTLFFSETKEVVTVDPGKAKLINAIQGQMMAPKTGGMEPTPIGPQQQKSTAR
jgi:hypothetical protein